MRQGAKGFIIERGSFCGVLSLLNTERRRLQISVSEDGSVWILGLQGAALSHTAVSEITLLLLLAQSVHIFQLSIFWNQTLRIASGVQSMCLGFHNADLLHTKVH